MPFRPLDRRSEIHVHRGNLPHWRQWGVTYFVTSRLADSVPAGVAQQWRGKRAAWLKERAAASADDLSDEDRSAYHREFTGRFHELLDAGHGDCLLARPESAGILETRFIAEHGSRYHLDSWVIMPNHFHALIEPAQGVILGDILKKWKGGSAREINLSCGRRGTVWQAEPFDHIVRSLPQLNHFRRYIAENPRKAGLRTGWVLGIGTDSGLTEDAILERFGLESSPGL
jgi:hypothetical protein